MSSDWKAKITKAVAPQMRQRAAEMESVLANFSVANAGIDSENLKPLLVAEFARREWTISEPELTRFANAIASGESIAVRSTA